MSTTKEKVLLKQIARALPHGAIATITEEIKASGTETNYARVAAALRGEDVNSALTEQIISYGLKHLETIVRAKTAQSSAVKNQLKKILASV